MHKLSIISNKKGFIYSVTNCNIKNKYKNYSTSVHDVKTINNSINEIQNIKNKSKYFILLGDKAYKTKDKFKLLNKPIKIITPDAQFVYILHSKMYTNMRTARIYLLFKKK